MEGGSEQKVGEEYDLVRVTNAILAKVSFLMSSAILQHPLMLFVHQVDVHVGIVTILLSPCISFGVAHQFVGVNLHDA